MASHKAYKDIVQNIINIDSIETYNKAYASIDRAYDIDSITFAEHEQLFSLLAKVGCFYGYNV